MRIDQFAFPVRRRSTKSRRKSEWAGRAAEIAAAVFLMLKGYRILARRVRTSHGELDLVAVRGQRLAFVEVKYRDTFEAAEVSVSDGQAARMADAAEQWAWDHPAYRNHRFGLDAVYVVPWRWPRYLKDGLQPL